MIFIEKPIITAHKNKSRLSAIIKVDNQEKECFFEVDKPYERYLTSEVADAFVVGLLHRAMTGGHDIVSKAPVSESVLYGLENFFIPNLCFADPNMHHIKIIADPIESPKSEGAVGTGLSLGIDSFDAIYENMNSKYVNHNITHLCLFNAGAFYSGEENFWNMIPKVQSVATKLGLPLVIGNSNIHDIIYGDYQITHTFYSLFCVFALRKLFHIYYYASAYPLYKFSCINNALIGNGTASYDLLTFHCLSDENLLLYSAGSGKKTRIEKTKAIMNKKIVQENLDVCILHKSTNCGKCIKCKRTMIQLFLLGYLNKFSKVFPVDYFYKHKQEYIKWMKRNKSKSKLERETYDYYIASKKIGVIIKKFILGQNYKNKTKNVFE